MCTQTKLIYCSQAFQLRPEVSLTNLKEPSDSTATLSNWTEHCVLPTGLQQKKKRNCLKDKYNEMMILSWLFVYYYPSLPSKHRNEFVCWNSLNLKQPQWCNKLKLRIV